MPGGGAHAKTGHVAAASSSSDSGAVERFELPIFPLNMVALPAATVPLMIFEAR